MPNHIPFAKRTMINGLLILLAIPCISTCSPSGENPSPLDIQKGPSSPYDVEANWICVKEENAQRSACPQQVLPATVDKRIWYAYTNVGLATIPEGAMQVTISINGTVVVRRPSYGPTDPGREERIGKPPRFFRRAEKGAGTYEVMLELKFSEKFEEANTGNNVVVQMVEVRE